LKIGIFIVKVGRGDQLEDGVAQVLKPLIAFGEVSTFVEVAAVDESITDQMLVGDGQIEGSEKFG